MVADLVSVDINEDTTTTMIGTTPTGTRMTSSVSLEAQPALSDNLNDLELIGEPAISSLAEIDNLTPAHVTSATLYETSVDDVDRPLKVDQQKTVEKEVLECHPAGHREQGEIVSTMCWSASCSA